MDLCCQAQSDVQLNTDNEVGTTGTTTTSQHLGRRGVVARAVLCVLCSRRSTGINAAKDSFVNK